MEELMDHISLFNESDEETRELHDSHSVIVDEFDYLYGLKINNKIVCVCQILFPVLDYIAKRVDWIGTPWKIVLFTS